MFNDSNAKNPKKNSSSEKYNQICLMTKSWFFPGLIFKGLFYCILSLYYFCSKWLDYPEINALVNIVYSPYSITSLLLLGFKNVIFCCLCNFYFHTDLLLTVPRYVWQGFEWHHRLEWVPGFVALHPTVEANLWPLWRKQDGQYWGHGASTRSVCFLSIPSLTTALCLSQNNCMHAQQAAMCHLATCNDVLC